MNHRPPTWSNGESIPQTNGEPTPWDAKPAKNAAEGGQMPSEPQPSAPPLSLLVLLADLTQALQVQTEAITRLAVSNENIIQMLMQAMSEDEQDPDAPPTHYMDGSPIR